MINPHLCPHQMNPISCPTCYRNKPPAPKGPQPGVHQGPPMGRVMDIGEATMRATQRAAVTSKTSVAAQPGVAFKEPYSSARPPPPEAYGDDKPWVPPAHESLIDRQPRHPHAEKSVAKTLKV